MEQQQLQSRDLAEVRIRPTCGMTGDVCLALEHLENPEAHGVTRPDGVMESAVFLCDIASSPGAETAFSEAQALPRLKELLWLLTPYAELQIIVAECLICTLHRLVDTHSQYRRLMVEEGFVPLLVHLLECTTQPGVAVHASFIRRAASTILARLANKCESRQITIVEAGAVAPLLRTFAAGIPELGAALLPRSKTPAAPVPEEDRYLHGYYCAVEHERLASAAAAAALAALTQGCSRACNIVTAEADAGVLVAYPLVVGCASISAVNQETEAVLQVLLNLAAVPKSCQAVRDAGIAMVLQSLIHSVAAALASKSGRRSPRRQREVYRKILSCSLELLDKLGHSYVISTLSREPLFSISEDCEVHCPEESNPPRFVKTAFRAMDSLATYIKGRVSAKGDADSSFYVDW